MTTSTTIKIRSDKNSSLTRVRPFFRLLFDKDAAGISWLPKLLEITPLNRELASRMASMSCRIQDICLVKRDYSDKILGIIQLEKCFEYSIAPTKAFLTWLIQNPDKLSWPDHGKKTFGEHTQAKRDAWLGKHGETKQEHAINEALKLIELEGVESSCKKWWAFEGVTELDCLLETDEFLLGIEGKRTEKVSHATDWYPKRNQIVRNLEVLKDKARGKDFALLLMSEDGTDPLSEADFIDSLPHFSPQEIADLKENYLGAVSWKQTCDAVGVDFDILPDNRPCD